MAIRELASPIPQVKTTRHMDGKRDIIAAWVAKEILPHEAAVYGWLARRWRHAIDPDDVIQEAYCRIASLSRVDHIENPVGYFRRTVHTVATDMLRRDGIFNFTAMTEIEWMNVMDSEPLADQVLEASQELERVNALLSQLSDVGRQAIEMRRIEKISQRETARCLGVSEDVIRNHLVRGVKKILGAIAAQDAQASYAEGKETVGEKFK